MFVLFNQMLQTVQKNDTNKHDLPDERALQEWQCSTPLLHTLKTDTNRIQIVRKMFKKKKNQGLYT